MITMIMPPIEFRALEYTLDEINKTATLVWGYRNTPDVFTLLWGMYNSATMGIS